MIESPIRSGRSVIFPYGDVSVLGSVFPGAEVVAGGPVAAVDGDQLGFVPGAENPRPRVAHGASHGAAAERAIDVDRSAEEIDASLRTRPAQCWLEDRILTIAALD